jgi:hypothetical protein
MEKLVAMVQVLSGRASDTGAKKEISVPAFLNLAQSLGISLHKDDLGTALGEPPLSNVFEPYQPSSETLQFKGAPVPDVGLPPDSARDVVAKNAKAAMKRS